MFHKLNTQSSSNSASLNKDTQSSKYDLDDWNALEVNLNPHEKAVIEMLKKTAEEGTWNGNNQEKNINSFNEQYNIIRTNSYINMQLNLPISIKKNESNILSQKKNKKIQSKADIIRENNTKDKIEKEILDLVNKFSNNTQLWREIPTSLFNDSIEIKIIALMFHIDGMTKKIDVITEEEKYNLTFGCAKVIDKLLHIQVRNIISGININVPTQLIDDICFKFDQFKQKFYFDIKVATTRYPKLFIFTPYDNILPGMVMAPYKSQIEIIEGIIANKENGLLACLNTLTGEGKTSLIIAIARLAQIFNKDKNKHKQKQNIIEVIYCCSERLKTVRQQVCQYAFNAVIPFGIATIDQLTHIVKIVDNYNCKKIGSPRILTIADIESTINILKNNIINHTPNVEYILVFDEPTINLDQLNSPMIDYLAKIYAYMPKITIFSTATAPNRESIPLLEEIFIQKFPQAEIKFIKSTRVQIGSEISNLDGQIYIPHNNCKNINELEQIIAKIKDDGFIQKCYTANVVNEMYNQFLIMSNKFKFAIDDIENFDSYMRIPGNLNQQAIQNLAISYLEKVYSIGKLLAIQCANIQTDFISQFCSLDFIKFKVDFTKLATDGHLFKNQSLIVTTDPKKFFDQYFLSYINDVHIQINNSTKTFSSLYEFYQKELSIYKQKLMDITNSKEKNTKTNKSMKTSKEITKNDSDYMLQDNITELEKSRPRIQIPMEMIIGSIEYMRMRDLQIKSATKSINYSMHNENINWNNIKCDDKYHMGLALGIGIFSPTKMDITYTRKIIELASNGQLHYILADDDICYGTNYPIENVIVDDTCMNSHSVKTIFQVFARAGRPGKSWRANIFAHNTIIQKIQDYVFSRNYTDIEAINMNLALVKSKLL